MPFQSEAAWRAANFPTTNKSTTNTAAPAAKATAAAPATASGGGGKTHTVTSPSGQTSTLTNAQYVASQQQRYQSALAAGDKDLVQRLQADATRVGYSLAPNTPANGATPSGGQNSPQMSVINDRLHSVTNSSGQRSTLTNQQYVASQQQRYVDAITPGPTFDPVLAKALIADAARAGYRLDDGEQSDSNPTPWSPTAIRNNGPDPRYVDNIKGTFHYADQYGLQKTTSDLHTALRYGRGDIRDGNGQVIGQATGLHYLTDGRVMTPDQYMGRDQGQVRMPRPQDFQNDPEGLMNALQEYYDAIKAGVLPEGATRPTPGISRSTDVYGTQFVPSAHGNIMLQTLGRDGNTIGNYWAATNDNWRMTGGDAEIGQVYNRQNSPFGFTTKFDRTENFNRPPNGYVPGAHQAFVDNYLANAVTFRHDDPDIDGYKWNPNTGKYDWVGFNKLPEYSNPAPAPVAGVQAMGTPVAAPAAQAPVTNAQDWSGYMTDLHKRLSDPAYDAGRATPERIVAEMHRVHQQTGVPLPTGVPAPSASLAQPGQQGDQLFNTVMDYMMREEAPVNWQYQAPTDLRMTSPDEARAQAKDLYDPLYELEMKREMDKVRGDLIRRGFFGQLPGAVLEQSTAENVQLQKQAAVAQLAHQIMGQSREDANRQLDRHFNQWLAQANLTQDERRMAQQNKQHFIGNLMQLMGYQADRFDKDRAYTFDQQKFAYGQQMDDRNWAFEQEKWDYGKQQDAQMMALKERELAMKATAAKGSGSGSGGNNTTGTQNQWAGQFTVLGQFYKRPDYYLMDLTKYGPQIVSLVGNTNYRNLLSDAQKAHDAYQKGAVTWGANYAPDPSGKAIPSPIRETLRDLGVM